MSGDATWRKWLSDHGVPSDPALGPAPAVLQAWINARVTGLGKRVPTSLRASVFAATANLARVPEPVADDTTAADQAWLAWLTASTAAATNDPTTIDTLTRFGAWLSTVPGTLTKASQDDLVSWSDTFAKLADTASDASKHGLDNLIDVLGHLQQTLLKPIYDALSSIEELLWGVLALGAFALGLGAVILLSGGGQAALAAFGMGYGASLPIVAGGFAGGIQLFARANLVLAGGFAQALLRWPEALRLIPMLGA